jgi:acetyl-CoA C-acetyltransferase
MPTVIRTLEVPHKPAQVWAVGGNLGRYGEWCLTHVSFPDGTPALKVGNKFREKVTIMGMPGEVNWEITELEVPRRFAMSGEGPMGIKLVAGLELNETTAGTAASMEASFHGGPLMGPLGDAVGKAAEKATDESLENLRVLAAAEAVPV